MAKFVRWILYALQVSVIAAIVCAPLAGLSDWIMVRLGKYAGMATLVVVGIPWAWLVISLARLAGRATKLGFSNPYED